MGSREKRMGSGGRSLHNEELHNSYRSPNIVRVIKSRRMRWASHVSRMEEGRAAFKMLTDTPLGRPKRSWEDNIRKYLKEIGINTRNWVDSAQDRNYWRALNAALNLRILYAMELISYRIFLPNNLFLI